MSAAAESSASSQPSARPATGETTDDGKGRIFPCEGCGSDLRFHVGVQKLQCEHCGFTKELALAVETLPEQDFHAMVARMQKQHDARRDSQSPGAGTSVVTDAREVRCESCAAKVVFMGGITSTDCAYCGSPIQIDSAEEFKERVRIDGVLPFRITREAAHTQLAAWVRSRWFAPNKFKKLGVSDKFSGCYMPYWTYDSLTQNAYRGERGEHYWVTVGTGKNRRRVRHTRWYPAAGKFQRFFDDVLVPAAGGLPPKLVEKLEPWRLDLCTPFQQDVIAGFQARRYEVSLEQGFKSARGQIDAAIRADVRARIGGDEQRIHAIQTHYDAVTYKLLLLPVWLLSYKFHAKLYQLLVNASTGEVQGQRPYSWIKITLTVLLSLAIVLGGIALFKATES
ncbi:MAG: hypothetical protein ACKVX7_19535 [Planctomycetota bacterium]